MRFRDLYVFEHVNDGTRKGDHQCIARWRDVHVTFPDSTEALVPARATDRAGKVVAELSACDDCPVSIRAGGVRIRGILPGGEFGVWLLRAVTTTAMTQDQEG